MKEELLKHGAFSWFELMTDDADAAKKFYTQLLDWEFEKFPAGSDDYWVVKMGEEGTGGIMKKPAEAAQAPNYWATYITVDDVDKVAAKATELGATIIVPPMDIPNIGRFCTLMDPQGAVISAITYAPM